MSEPMSPDRPTARVEASKNVEFLESQVEHQRAQILDRMRAHDEELKNQLLIKIPVSSTDVSEVLLFKVKDELSNSYYGLHPKMGVIEVKGSVAKDIEKRQAHSTMEDLLKSAKPETGVPEPVVKIRGARLQNWERAWRDSAEAAEDSLREEDLKEEKLLLDQAVKIGEKLAPNRFIESRVVGLHDNQVLIHDEGRIIGDPIPTDVKGDYTFTFDDPGRLIDNQRIRDIDRVHTAQTEANSEGTQEPNNTATSSQPPIVEDQ